MSAARKTNDPGRPRALKQQAVVYALAFVDGSGLVSVSTSGLCRLWDVASGEAVRQIQVGRDAQLVTMPYEGTSLAAVLKNRKLAAWDLWEGDRRFCVPPPPGTGKIVDLAAGHGLLAATTFDGHAYLWDYSTGEVRGGDSPRLTPEGAGEPGLLLRPAIAPGGRLLAACTQGWAVVWDVAERRQLTKLPLPPDAGAAVLEFSPDGQLLAFGGKNGTVVLWDVATGAERRVCPSIGRPVECLRFWPGGRLLAWCNGGGEVRLARAEGTELLPLRAAGEFTALAVAPDGSRLAAGGLRGPIFIWPARDLGAALP